ncbi:MAG: hypothetical protein V3T31_00070, partial [candidate division Zixibacteria bacterium]
IGAVSHKLDGEIVLYDASDGSTYLGTSDFSESKFAANLGAGITTMFSRSVGLDIGLHWDIVFVGTTGERSFGSSNVVYAHIFDLHTGLIFYM